MKKELPKLDARLAAAIPYIREGETVADVGTDHAYLPIYLILTGKTERAVASDIHKGPIERARANLRAAGIGDRVATLCTDGLHGLEEYAPGDILIFGMGGDLIARIVEEAPWLRREGKRLILQPMTHADTVREYLTGNGWHITDEALVRADRVYQIIVADFCGEPQPPLEEAEKRLGRINLSRGGEMLAELLAREIRATETRIAGKQSAGQDTCAERELLAQLEERRNQNGCYGK